MEPPARQFALTRQLVRIVGQMAAPADTPAGLVVVMLEMAWRDGTTYQVMSPLEFMRQLAAPLPRPGLSGP